MLDEKICCPKFNPELWDEKNITWEGKNFIKDSVICFMHVPLNMGGVIRRMWSKVEGTEAELKPEEFMILSEDVSNWKSVQYMSVAKEVEGAENVKISGTFMAKVFEGPYKEAGKWYGQMMEYVKAQGKEPKKIYAWYTTCPKCAKKYGKNYTVLLAQV